MNPPTKPLAQTMSAERLKAVLLRLSLEEKYYRYTGSSALADVYKDAAAHIRAQEQRIKELTALLVEVVPDTREYDTHTQQIRDTDLTRRIETVLHPL